MAAFQAHHERSPVKAPRAYCLKALLAIGIYIVSCFPISALGQMSESGEVIELARGEMLEMGDGGELQGRNIGLPCTSLFCPVDQDWKFRIATHGYRTKRDTQKKCTTLLCPRNKRDTKKCTTLLCPRGT